MQVTAVAVAAFQAGHEGSIPFARSIEKLQFRAHMTGPAGRPRLEVIRPRVDGDHFHESF